MAQKFTVSADSSLLKCLFELFPQQSRTGVKACLQDGRVVVNGVVRTAFDWPLRQGDTIEILPKGVAIGREMKSDAVTTLKKSGITIVFEDEHLIVIEKEAGVPVRRPKNPEGGRIVKSVQSLMTDYLHTEKRADIKAGEGSYNAPSRIFVIHRMDSQASGLMLLAKDERTRDLILSKWDSTILDYRFTTLLEGHPAPQEGRIESWLTDNAKTSKVFSSHEEGEGLRSVSFYKVTESRKRFSLVEFRPSTIRRHQIRVHAAVELGHPVAGDRKYGSSANFGGRLAIHASALTFRNPYGGKVLTFTSPLPASFSLLK